MTVTALKVAKKRREQVRKIIYDRQGTVALGDEEIRSIMRNVQHLTSLTSIIINCNQ
jgi:hypothetical protein